MGWILRIIAALASWMKLKSSVQQTTEGVKQASAMASGLQEKHTQESLAKAMAGDPAAGYDLGERYYDGRGVTRDYRQAAQWFAQAAEQGHVKAQTNLGLMFIVGRGVPKNLNLARQYLMAAARAGDETAKASLRRIQRQAPGRDRQSSRPGSGTRG